MALNRMSRDADLTDPAEAARLYETLELFAQRIRAAEAQAAAAVQASNFTTDIGTILAWPGRANNVPANYLVCDGRTLNAVDYPALYGVMLSSQFPTTGTTFTLPDLRGRKIVGSNTGEYPAGIDGSRVARVEGTNSGAEFATILDIHMPPHSHGINDPGHSHGVTDPGHSHNIPRALSFAIVPPFGAQPNGTGAGNTSTDSNVTGVSVDPATTGITTALQGGGLPLNVEDPGLSLVWLIRAL